MNLPWHETVSARPDSAIYRVRTFARRHRAGVAAAALVLVTLAGATIYSTRQATIAARERDRSAAALARAEAVAEFYQFLLADAGPPDAGPLDAIIAPSDRSAAPSTR